jgi:hypothetical protein
LFIASVGIVFGVDLGYKKYSKKSLKEIIDEFKSYRVQSDAQLAECSNNAIWYAEKLGPQCAKKTQTYIKMNQDPIPENYEELAEFLIAYDFRKSFNQEQSIGAQLRSIIDLFASPAMQGLHVFECLVAVQEKRIENILDKQ